MVNYQLLAVRIEHKLKAHGYAISGDADSIVRDPLGYMNIVLLRYEKQSERNEQKALDFWERYKSYKGHRFDEFDEEVAKKFANDISALFA